MQENKNEQNTGTKTIKKIGKVTYEDVVHFNENATETMQDKAQTFRSKCLTTASLLRVRAACRELFA